MDKSLKKLLVWNQAMDLAEGIYRVTEKLPKGEEFGLKSQMRRAAISIPSNIAEGSARGTSKDFASFLRIAKGSLRELETQLELANRVGNLEQDPVNQISVQIDSVSKLLIRLTKSQTPD